MADGTVPGCRDRGGSADSAVTRTGAPRSSRSSAAGPTARRSARMGTATSATTAASIGCTMPTASRARTAAPTPTRRQHPARRPGDGARSRRCTRIAATCRCSGPTTSCSTGSAAASGSPTTARATTGRWTAARCTTRARTDRSSSRSRSRSSRRTASACRPMAARSTPPRPRPGGCGPGRCSAPAELAKGRVALTRRGRMVGAASGYQRFDSLAVEADGNVGVASTGRRRGQRVRARRQRPGGVRRDAGALQHQHLLRRPGPAHRLYHAIGLRRLVALDWPRAGLPLVHQR